jgi:hypothetical protein
VLSEQKIIDQIMIDEHDNVHVRVANRVLRDGEVISETYHRRVIMAGESGDAEPARIKAIRNALRR